jgi:hypothetical protein
MSLDDESIIIQLELRYQLRSNTQSFELIFFELTIFTTVPLSIYNAIIMQYNSYQEFGFKLHYINSTWESIYRG